MLGGNHWKIMRTSDDMPCKANIYNAGTWLYVAKRHGEDLVVSNDLFDFIENAVEQAKPDLPNPKPKWDDNELFVLGQMLTATRGTDTARLANIVSRLMTLYAKFVCDEEPQTCAARLERDRLGLALMMIKEGCAEPKRVAAEAIQAGIAGKNK